MEEEKIREKMQVEVEDFKQEILSLRSGRANPGLIENIEVEVYGGQQRMKLVELGTIGVADPRTLSFQPWDLSIINEIKNGIAKANLGLNPVVDQNIIRISLPVLTTEQREEYIKILAKKSEEAKVKIRDIRAEERYQWQEQLKNKEISKDEFRNQEEVLQKITDEYIAKIQEITLAKEREIRGD
jgi:ribosome recycling factor